MIFSEPRHTFRDHALGGARLADALEQHHVGMAQQRQQRGAGGEIQLTDAMIGLAKTQQFYGVEFEGERHDCGSKAGFLRANIAFGMARADLRDGLREEMKRYLEK